MTESAAESALGGGRSRPGRVILAVLDFVSHVFQTVLSRRGLGICFLVAMGVLSVRGWVRPPLSPDIGGLSIPLLSNSDPDFAAKLVSGPGRIAPLGVGTVLLSVTAVGLVLTVRRRVRLRLASGLLLAAVVLCMLVVMLNHPAVDDELDRQGDQHRSFITVMRDTANPPVDVTYYPRVRTTPDTRSRGPLLSMWVYVPNHQVAFGILAMLGVALAYGGPLHRRLGCVAAWGLVGVVGAGALSFSRLSAERLWSCAVDAERHGRLDAAAEYAGAALVRCPVFTNLERTWDFMGKLDYVRGRDTPAAHYFLAAQWSRNGQATQAIAEFEILHRSGQPTPLVGRWLADELDERAMALFVAGQLEGAADAWRRSVEADPQQRFRRLFSLALEATAERVDPDRIAALADPVLTRMADRALRAAAEAMLGDCYFECGRFAEARARYEESLRLYSLPKQINFRAIRGMLGM